MPDYENSTATYIAGWGQEFNYGGTDGVALPFDYQRNEVGLHSPQKLAVAADGRVFIADAGNNAIRVAVQQAGTWRVSTYAGGLLDVVGLTLDKTGSMVFTSAAGSKVLRLRADGTTADLGGGVSAVGTTGVDGALVDGPIAAAAFNAPRGVAFAANGNAYVADTFNHCIRQIK
jgi:DNA-binding beta-propeller fold protein YncE